VIATETTVLFVYVQHEPEYLSDDRSKPQLAANASTAPQYIQYTFSALQAVDEIDPIFGALESILQTSTACPSNLSVKMP